MTLIKNKIREFISEEDGIALTEYLILLGILSAAAITAVTASGNSLGSAWQAWETFFGDLSSRGAPDITDVGGTEGGTEGGTG